MSKALDDLRKLQRRVREIAQGLNLEIGGFMVAPAPEDGGRDSVRVTFILSPESVETAEETEKRRTDAEFEALMGGIGLSEDFLTEDEKSVVDEEASALDAAKDSFKKRFGND